METDYLPPGQPPLTTAVATHDVTDVDTHVIAKLGISLYVLLVGTIVLMVAVFWLADRRARNRVGGPPPAARGADIRIAPQPRLISSAGENYRPEDFTHDPLLQAEIRRGSSLRLELDRAERLGEVYRLVKRRELTTYGVVGPGEYRVPVEQAKDMLLSRPDPLAPIAGGDIGVPPLQAPAGPVPDPGTPLVPPGRGTTEGRDRPEEVRRPPPDIEHIQYADPQYGPMRSPPATDRGVPLALQDVGFEQRLGAELPSDVVFRDEQGRPWRLRDVLGRRPIALAFAYYACPMLCSQVLTAMASSFRTLAFEPGRDYEIVVVSFDPRENDQPGLAAARKAAIVGEGEAARGWHFLTGDRQAIDEITRTAGFTFRWNPASEQFAHATGLMIATPDGRLSHYIYGVSFPPRDVRLALIEASAGRIGSAVDALLLYCFHYDPASGRYTPVIMNVLRIMAAMLIVAGGAGLFVLNRRTSRSGRAA